MRSNSWKTPPILRKSLKNLSLLLHTVEVQERFSETLLWKSALDLFLFASVIVPLNKSLIDVLHFIFVNYVKICTRSS